MLSMGKNRWATRARNIIQRFSLTCTRKEAFNCCPWPSNNFSKECNVPEGIEKVDNHSFFHTGDFSSSGLGGSLLFF